VGLNVVLVVPRSARKPTDPSAPGPAESLMGFFLSIQPMFSTRPMGFYLSFDSRVHAYFWVADIFSLKSAGA
jgi:hypothetical protein